MLWQINKNASQMVVLFVIMTAAIARLTYYGDLRLSIATSDTGTYTKASRTSLLSYAAFTNNRLFSTSLLYQLSGSQYCKIEAFSFPAIGVEARRRIQSCFNNLVLTQNIVSLMGWVVLAWVVSTYMRSGFGKTLSAALILTFGFTPPIADWDSILGSESLTFSLFALSLGSLILMSFNITQENRSELSLFKLNIAGIFVFFLFVFVRDVNIYAIIVLLGLTIPLFLFSTIRRRKVFLVTTFLLAGLVILGLKSSYDSRRWKMPLTNVFNDILLPVPSRSEYLRRTGMPDPASSSYQTWFNSNATGAYARFLLTNPEYALSSITLQAGSLFSENMQPYFKNPDSQHRNLLISIGDMLHIKSILVVAADVILLLITLITAYKFRELHSIIWGWLAVWLFVVSSVTFFIGLFADSTGVARHTLLSVELYRLALWVLVAVIMDWVVTRVYPFRA
jgi:hypothetical protein